MKLKQRSTQSLLVLLGLILALNFNSCATKGKKKGSKGSGVEASQEIPDNPIQLNGSSDESNAGGLSTVNFDFDSSVIRSDARQVLDNNVYYLKENKSVEIQIEGHCDERGSIEYNMALGERRAMAIKKYLIASGISSSRITTVSFGKERPVAFGHDESSWAQNRRGNFVVTVE